MKLKIRTLAEGLGRRRQERLLLDAWPGQSRGRWYGEIETKQSTTSARRSIEVQPACLQEEEGGELGDERKQEAEQTSSEALIHGGVDLGKN
jgi:hypothetical protein